MGCFQPALVTIINVRSIICVYSVSNDATRAQTYFLVTIENERTLQVHGKSSHPLEFKGKFVDLNQFGTGDTLINVGSVTYCKCQK